MAVQYMTSIGDTGQIEKLLKGDQLDGRKEKRIVFAGRSNAGKSSLLNALTRTKAAHISREPGKTRKVNLFFCSMLNRVVVDLPGYGFAKRNKTEKRLWGELISAYMSADQANIDWIVLVTDSRHGPADSDLEAMKFFQESGLPVCLVLSKIDKLNQKQLNARKKEVKELLAGYSPDRIFWTSSSKGKGVREVSNEITNG